MSNSSSSLSILTLGDGDFTYSLDLARHFAAASKQQGNSDNRTIHLVATGIDTNEELLAKYKDAAYILKQLDLIHSSIPEIFVKVQHGVNAILPPDDGLLPAADYVMFHHPHLGTEDAALHGRFLCHLFHSCTTVWLKPQGGLLYLTLVKGQFERWNCEQAARHQGLKLLRREAFGPPPVQSPTYHYRRHQTGKSFESRRPCHGSETFVFGREIDQGNYVSTSLLSWPDHHAVIGQTSRADDDKSSSTKEMGSLLPCPYCDRSFIEERSRKRHVGDKHADESSEKRTRTSLVQSFNCAQCQTETGEARSFESEQALQDHIKAKHSALHKTILPDWCRRDDDNRSSSGVTSCNNKTTTTKVVLDRFSACAICGAEFDSQENEAAHVADFRPKPPEESFACRFCDKSFRESRAKLQHENFCKERPSK